jgi:hypothetical protein
MGTIKAVPKIFFRRGFYSNFILLLFFFLVGVTQKTSKNAYKFVYVHFFYVFTSQKNISGGGQTP